MRITVLGATGMLGSRIVAEAANRGHQVIAVSRHGGLRRHGVVPVIGDAADEEQMRSLFRMSEVVVVATRPAPGEESSAETLTSALLSTAVATESRIVVIGGAGPLRSPTDPGLLVIDDPRFVRPKWRRSAAVSVAQLRACSARPEADCTYVSPPALIAPGQRTGTYRRGTTELLVDESGVSDIAAEDFAVAVVDELESPGQDRHFTVARLGSDAAAIDGSWRARGRRGGSLT